MLIIYKHDLEAFKSLSFGEEFRDRLPWFKNFVV